MLRGTVTVAGQKRGTDGQPCVDAPSWVCETAWACKHFVQDMDILSSTPFAQASLVPAVPGQASQHGSK